MSQQSIFKLLKRKKKWMTSKEMARILGIRSVNASLRKLYDQGEILRREVRIKGINFGHWTYQYKIK